MMSCDDESLVWPAEDHGAGGLLPADLVGRRQQEDGRCLRGAQRERLVRQELVGRRETEEVPQDDADTPRQVSVTCPYPTPSECHVPIPHAK